METVSLDLSLEKELIEYYEAFEMLLDVAREYGVYKTHFGILDKPLDSNYCWFKSITRPDLFPKYNRYLRSAFQKFHLQLFYSGDYCLEYKKVLDVGFGTGGTVHGLASEWPEAEIHGININEVQYIIAKEQCQNDKNVRLHLGNFLNYEFNQKFDLIYFIESAFHILDKESLAQKVSSLCNELGDVYITDIIFSEQFAGRAKTNHDDNSIFEYMSLNEWIMLFRRYGLEFMGFDDLSEKVANVITITTPEEVFKREYVQPLVGLFPKKEVYLDRIMHAFKSYSQLHRLLRLKILKYGILRFRKIN